ncbi:HDOD domain-containing protein [Kamptonema cortianum]|nr:HDOD domain-containing protein [Kamptonema cortianum]
MALRSENFLLRRYIEKAMVDLPALPTVVMQVVQATEKETATTTEIEDLLVADAAITTKLLKVVNSAYFGLPRQIVNVNQTIAILGMHQVRNLVMSIGVLSAFNSPSPRIIEVQKQFWQQAFAAASCAENIGKHKGLGKKDLETIFVGSLLHDVGKLFLFTLFNLPYQEVLKESVNRREPVESVEQRVLGTTHAELGGILAERWNFPEILIEMIRFHHEPPEIGASDAIFCAHVADAVANELAPVEFNGVPSTLDSRAKAWLGYNAEQWEKLKSDTAKQVELAKEMLGVM